MNHKQNGRIDVTERHLAMAEWYDLIEDKLAQNAPDGPIIKPARGYPPSMQFSSAAARTGVSARLTPPARAVGHRPLALPGQLLSPSGLRTPPSLLRGGT
jgi:hypothetical protein